MWNFLPENSKLMYVVGIQDGLMIAASWADPASQEHIMGAKPAGFFPGDYVKEMDALYRDSENLPVVMPFA